jgi:hypothetical protein
MSGPYVPRLQLLVLFGVSDAQAYHTQVYHIEVTFLMKSLSAQRSGRSVFMYLTAR